MDQDALREESGRPGLDRGLIRARRRMDVLQQALFGVQLKIWFLRQGDKNRRVGDVRVPSPRVQLLQPAAPYGRQVRCLRRQR